MTTKNKFTDNIINSTLKLLEKEHGWNKELVNKVMQLYQTNNLNNLQSLSNIFEEIAASKEGKEDD